MNEECRDEIPELSRAHALLVRTMLSSGANVQLCQSTLSVAVAENVRACALAPTLARTQKVADLPAGTTPASAHVTLPTTLVPLLPLVTPFFFPELTYESDSGSTMERTELSILRPLLLISLYCTIMSLPRMGVCVPGDVYVRHARDRSRGVSEKMYVRGHLSLRIDFMLQMVYPVQSCPLTHVGLGKEEELDALGAGLGRGSRNQEAQGEKYSLGDHGGGWGQDAEARQMLLFAAGWMRVGGSVNCGWPGAWGGCCGCCVLVALPRIGLSLIHI